MQYRHAIKNIPKYQEHFKITLESTSGQEDVKFVQSFLRLTRGCGKAAALNQGVAWFDQRSRGELGNDGCS